MPDGVLVEDLVDVGRTVEVRSMVRSVHRDCYTCATLESVTLK